MNGQDPTVEPPQGPVPAEVFTIRTGVVDTFDDFVGAGTVIDDATGACWPLHCTAIADGSRTIAVGAAVTFQVRPGPTGFEATDVAIGPVV